MQLPILAIDLGLKRIGVALCVNEAIITPLAAVLRKNRNQAANEIKQLIASWHIQTIVMGIPMGGDSEDEMRRRAGHFVSLLDFEGVIVYQDESESSLEAKALMKGEIKEIRDGRLDSLSAKIILERALRENT